MTDAVPPLRDGRYRLVELLGVGGIALVDRAGPTLTRAGSTMGTLEYMAPEQRTDAHAVDERADIYAVAATLYHLLTGREPFDLYSSEAHAQLDAGHSPALAPLTVKGSRFRAVDRSSTAADMLLALREVIPALQASPPEASPLGVTTRSVVAGDPKAPAAHQAARAGPPGRGRARAASGDPGWSRDDTRDRSASFRRRTILLGL